MWWGSPYLPVDSRQTWFLCSCAWLWFWPCVTHWVGIVTCLPRSAVLVVLLGIPNIWATGISTRLVSVGQCSGLNLMPHWPQLESLSHLYAPANAIWLFWRSLIKIWTNNCILVFGMVFSTLVVLLKDRSWDCLGIGIAQTSPYFFDFSEETQVLNDIPKIVFLTMLQWMHLSFVPYYRINCAWKNVLLALNIIPSCLPIHIFLQLWFDDWIYSLWHLKDQWS